MAKTPSNQKSAALTEEQWAEVLKLIRQALGACEYINKPRYLFLEAIDDEISQQIKE
ncbi:MAG TPA: hypothetical protein VI937_03290 [Negativicutes bacterium]|nr:hypothetical protein [Negativicutes bacterium]